MIITTKFEYGDWVLIDGDPSLAGRVLSYQVRTTYASPAVEVSWMHYGELKTQWVEEWRLEAASRHVPYREPPPPKDEGGIR